jgi:signal transduction histidine kinase
MDAISTQDYPERRAGSKLYPTPDQDEASLRAALNTAVSRSLRSVSIGLGLLHAVYAVGYLLAMPEEIALLMAMIAEVTAVGMLLFSLALGRRPAPSHRAQLYGAVLAGLVLINSLLAIYLTSNPHQTVQLVLLVAGAGFFFLSNIWLTLVIMLSFSGWALVVWSAPPSPIWALYGFVLLAGSVLSAAVHTERVRTIRRLESLRLQDARRKAELESVLISTEEAQRSLATSMAIGQKITSILDLDVLLNQIAELIKEHFKCSFVGIFLLDESGEYLVARAGTDDIGRALVRENFRLRVGQEGIAGWVAEKRRPALVDDVTQDSRYIWVDLLEGIQSELALPLEMGQTLLGVLDMQSDRLARFGEDEVPFLQTIADQAAIAIQNASNYEMVNRFNLELEEKIHQRTAALQSAYDQLERLDRTKSDFINVASHELRTPITVIQGYSQMLLEDPTVKQNSIQHQIASGIHGGANRLNDIVGSLLDIARIDSQALRLHYSPIVLSNLVEFVCSGLESSIKEREQTLVLEGLQDLPTIEADPEALKKVFYHLLVNAIKYTPDGGTITVAAHRLPANAQEDVHSNAIEVIISDTGIGVSPELHELIFQKFYQTGEVALHSTGKIKFKGGGPGLGLAIARGIVEAHKGRIWVESSGHDEVNFPGSRFHLWLPLKQ